MTVYIIGSTNRCAYNAEDETTVCTAEGFSIDRVACTDENGAAVTCPEFGEKDINFTGSAYVEMNVNTIGAKAMGLNADQFELISELDGVEAVAFDVIDGSVEVYDETMEGGVIDQSEPTEPAEEPVEPTDEPGDEEPEEPTAEPEDNILTMSVEEETGVKVFSNKYITIRVIEKKNAPVEEPVLTDTEDTAETPAEPVIDGNNDELNENNEEEKTAEDLDEDKETGTDELNEETDEKTAEEGNEDAENETEELNEETNDENDEELNEGNGEEELTEPAEGEEEKPAEDGEEEFQTVVSGDAAAEPTAEDGEVTPIEDEEAGETAPETLTLTAGMTVLDADGETVFTAGEDTELTILSVDENGRALVQLADGTQGYIQMPQEEEESEAETETAADAEADTTPKSLLFTADMLIYTDADAESEALEAALEEGAELTILSVDPETGWALVLLPDGFTSGYVLMPTEEKEEEPLTATVVAATDIRVAADGTSGILFNPEEDMEVIILGIEGDWIKVQYDGDKIGYIFINDIDFEGKPEKTYTDKKVTIFSDMPSEIEVGETVNLTSLLEGFEDCYEIKYQWECDKGDGFKPIEGANGENYSYAVSIESMAWSWHLVVYYK